MRASRDMSTELSSVEVEIKCRRLVLKCYSETLGYMLHTPQHHKVRYTLFAKVYFKYCGSQVIIWWPNNVEGWSHQVLV